MFALRFCAPLGVLLGACASESPPDDEVNGPVSMPTSTSTLSAAPPDGPSASAPAATASQDQAPASSSTASSSTASSGAEPVPTSDPCAGAGGQGSLGCMPPVGSQGGQAGTAEPAPSTSAAPSMAPTLPMPSASDMAPPAPSASEGPLPTDSGSEPPPPPTGAFTCPDEVGTPNYQAQIEVVPGIPTDTEFGGNFSTLEGVVWTSNGLLLSQIAYSSEPNPSRLLGFDGTQNPRVVLPQAGTNGLALGNDGELLGARHSDGVLAELDLEAGTSSVLVADFAGNAFNSPNDLAVRSDRNIYFTDPDYQWPELMPGAPGYRAKGTTRVYRVAPGGEVSVVDETRQQPNGVTLSLDESTLYSSGTGPLVRYALSASGEVEGSEVVPVVGNMLNAGDGMGLDCRGVLYVTMQTRVYAVDVTSNPAQPEIVHTFELDPSIEATNIAFGGADRSTLFISSQGAAPKLFKVELGVVGRPY